MWGPGLRTDARIWVLAFLWRLVVITPLSGTPTEYHKHNGDATCYGRRWLTLRVDAGEEGGASPCQLVLAVVREPGCQEQQQEFAVVNFFGEHAVQGGPSTLVWYLSSPLGTRSEHKKSTGSETPMEDDLRSISISRGKQGPLPPEPFRNIETWNFDIFLVPEEGLIDVINYIFERLNIFKEFGLDERVLGNFVTAVQSQYQNNPYHNFRHAIDVLHCLYMLCQTTEAKEMLSPIEIFAAAMAAICHDLGHPGVTNAFLIATQHPLSIMYNDLAILESYHSATTFEIMRDHPRINILQCLPAAEQRLMRDLMVTMILATDIGKHGVMMKIFMKRLEDQAPFLPSFESSPSPPTPLTPATPATPGISGQSTFRWPVSDNASDTSEEVETERRNVGSAMMEVWERDSGMESERVHKHGESSALHGEPSSSSAVHKSRLGRSESGVHGRRGKQKEKTPRVPDKGKPGTSTPLVDKGGISEGPGSEREMPPEETDRQFGSKLSRFLARTTLADDGDSQEAHQATNDEQSEKSFSYHPRPSQTRLPPLILPGEASSGPGSHGVKPTRTHATTSSRANSPVPPLLGEVLSSPSDVGSQSERSARDESAAQQKIGKRRTVKTGDNPTGKPLSLVEMTKAPVVQPWPAPFPVYPGKKGATDGIKSTSDGPANSSGGELRSQSPVTLRSPSSSKLTSHSTAKEKESTGDAHSASHPQAKDAGERSPHKASQRFEHRPGPVKGYKSTRDATLLLEMLIKCADLSNIVKPAVLSQRWAALLLLEFFRQGDTERRLGLPVSKFMDRNDPMAIKGMVCGFIDFIARPMFTILTNWLPSTKETLLPVLEDNYKRWSSFQNTTKTSCQVTLSFLGQYYPWSSDTPEPMIEVLGYALIDPHPERTHQATSTADTSTSERSGPAPSEYYHERPVSQPLSRIPAYIDVIDLMEPSTHQRATLKETPGAGQDSRKNKFYEVMQETGVGGKREMASSAVSSSAVSHTEKFLSDLENKPASLSQSPLSLLYGTLSRASKGATTLAKEIKSLRGAWRRQDELGRRKSAAPVLQTVQSQFSITSSMGSATSAASAASECVPGSANSETGQLGILPMVATKQWSAAQLSRYRPNWLTKTFKRFSHDLSNMRTSLMGHLLPHPPHYEDEDLEQTQKLPADDTVERNTWRAKMAWLAVRIEKLMMRVLWRRVMMVFVLITILFMDLTTAALPKEADRYARIILTVFFLVLICEMVVASCVIPGYFLKLFFWMDLVGTIMILPDLTTWGVFGFIRERLTLRHISREIRILRLARLISLPKSKGPIEPSNVWRILSQLTTQKLILGIMLMLIIIPFLHVQIKDGAPKVFLNTLDSLPQFSVDFNETLVDFEIFNRRNGYKMLFIGLAESPCKCLIERKLLTKTTSGNGGESAGTGVELPWGPDSAESKRVDKVEPKSLKEAILATVHNVCLADSMSSMLLGSGTPDLMSGISKDESNKEVTPCTLQHYVTTVRAPKAQNASSDQGSADPSSAASILTVRPMDAAEKARTYKVFRKEELWHIRSKLGVSEALFNIRYESQLDSIFEISICCFSLLVLFIWLHLFSLNTNRLLIQPIERMVNFVKLIAEDPLSFLGRAMGGAPVETNQEKETSQHMETSMIEGALVKITSLTKVAMGEAGMRILTENLKGNEFNPMIPGKKIRACFGFCDIRNFTDTTECLQEEVMLFVNKVAELVHSKAVANYGAPNKNIGDAFLIVWKKHIVDHTALKSGGSSFADRALRAFLEIIVEIETSTQFSAFTFHPAIQKRMPGYRIKMGFGLHVGWAIEGAIGSRHKVDPSYLSPHVNMAARLEAATKQYGVTILLSETVLANLSKPYLRSGCRRLDRVTVKGSAEPLSLFTFDLPVLQKGLKGDSTEYRERFTRGVDSYLLGDWNEAVRRLRQCQRIWPDDGPARVLLNFMERHGNKAPSAWKGFRELTEK